MNYMTYTILLNKLAKAKARKNIVLSLPDTKYKNNQIVVAMDTIADLELKVRNAELELGI